MSTRLLRVIGAVVSLSVLTIPATAHAADVTTKGLYISPIQDFISLNAGEQKSGTFTVADHTDDPIAVDLSVKQFSVTDYAYNYRFSSANDWLKLSVTSLSLQPNESESVAYSLAVPTGTAAGGQYYTLFASAQLGSGSLTSTVQATTLLYVTVEGKLVETSKLVKGSIQHFVFGNQITYHIDTKNTGNIHYFANFSGKLSGLTTHTNPGASHLLLPGPIRQVSGTIPSPLLPGVYHANYGYKTDAGTTANLSGWVVFIPPWFLALLAILALIIVQVMQRRPKKQQPKAAEATTPKA